MPTYIITTIDGIEVIDSTPEAGDRISSMEYLALRATRDSNNKVKASLYTCIKKTGGKLYEKLFLGKDYC